MSREGKGTKSERNSPFFLKSREAKRPGLRKRASKKEKGVQRREDVK